MRKITSKIENNNILIFIDWFLPGYKAGGPISSMANLVSQLSPYYKFNIITRNTDYCENKPYKSIEPDCWVDLSDSKVWYSSSQKLNRKFISQVIKDSSSNVVYINGIYSLYFSILPLWYAKKYEKNKIIIAPRGMLSSQAFTSKSFKKNIFLYFAKKIGLYKNIIFHVTNADEAEFVKKKIGGNSKILIAPNLAKKMPNFLIPINKVGNELKLVCFARISPEKNTLFAIKTLYRFSQLFKNKYNISLSLYGQIYDINYWQQCVEIIQLLPGNIKVIHKGDVHPDDLFKRMREYHFLFMPTTGENFGHSILESLMAGCPVIISDQTPWKSLQKISNEQLKINNYESYISVGWDIPLQKPDEFVTVLEYCAAMGQDKYNHMSKSAWEYAKLVTTDPKVIDANKKLFEL